MTQPLFFDASLQLEKVAYDTRLDDDPEEWPVAVIRESYKQLPFLKSYETEVEFDKMDTARGFGVGKMLVWPARMDKEAAAEKKQLVTVPIIVRNREMSPMDVYTHRDRMQPMDQDKVAALLFRPESIERPAPRDQFTGTNLYGQLIPPNTDHQYNAGGLNKHGSVKSKTASADMWEVISSTLTEEQRTGFITKLAQDHGLRHSVYTTPQLKSFADTLANAKIKTAAEMTTHRRGRTVPSVVQVREHGAGYLVKTANHRCFSPQEAPASRFEVQALLTKTAFNHLLDDGRVTVITGPVVVEAPTVKTAQEVTHLGVYQVRSAGKEQSGVVVPKVVDFDGRDLGMQIFFGEESHSMQEKIAGVFVEDHVLSSDAPSGLGVFVYQEGALAVATEPVKLTSLVKVAGVATLVGTRMSTGAPIQVSVVPGLRKIAMIGNEVSLPSSVRFLSLEGGQRKVASTVEDVHLFEHIKAAGVNSVELISDGSSYSFRGRNSNEAFGGQILDAGEAEFALGALGLTGAQSRHAMKTASTASSTVLPQTRQVLTEQGRGLVEMEKAASVISHAVGLAVDLTVEAALLTSPQAHGLWKSASVVVSNETTDAILSLGFVTPENASLYVNYLPEIEKCSSRLAELLVASRLGMDDVREAAAKNAMTQVNAVVRGLETLRERIQ